MFKVICLKCNHEFNLKDLDSEGFTVIYYGYDYDSSWFNIKCPNCGYIEEVE